jgi:hypothetical protein
MDQTPVLFMQEKVHNYTTILGDGTSLLPLLYLRVSEVLIFTGKFPRLSSFQGHFALYKITLGWRILA